MKQFFKSLLNYFNNEKTTYSHRNRTIEIVAQEQGLDINEIKDEVKEMLASEGRVEAIIKLRKRFHLPLVAAWRFVDKLDTK